MAVGKKGSLPVPYVIVVSIRGSTVKSGQPPYNGQTVHPCLNIVHAFLPPKKGQPLNNSRIGYILTSFYPSLVRRAPESAGSTSADTHTLH